MQLRQLRQLLQKLPLATGDPSSGRTDKPLCGCVLGFSAGINNAQKMGPRELPNFNGIKINTGCAPKVANFRLRGLIPYIKGRH